MLLHKIYLRYSIASARLGEHVNNLPIKSYPNTMIILEKIKNQFASISVQIWLVKTSS